MLTVFTSTWYTYGLKFSCLSIFYDEKKFYEKNLCFQKHIGGNSKKCIDICAKWSELVQIIKIKGVQRNSRAKDKHIYSTKSLTFLHEPHCKPNHTVLLHLSVFSPHSLPLCHCSNTSFCPAFTSCLQPSPSASCLLSSHIQLLLSHFTSFMVADLHYPSPYSTLEDVEGENHMLYFVGQLRAQSLPYIRGYQDPPEKRCA